MGSSTSAYPKRNIGVLYVVRYVAYAHTSTQARIVSAIARMAKEYGYQGWWPVKCERTHFDKPHGLLEQQGYHPEQFDFPRTRKGRFEICCGAVLTQNTAWVNVRHALANLDAARLTTPERVLNHPPAELSDLIRPAGYFNQKAQYLRALAEWFIGRDRRLSSGEPNRQRLEQARVEFLKVRGVGPETADSILLYAYSMPTFVVDAYTRRVFGRLSMIDARGSYESIRALLESALVQPTVRETVTLWQEAHALIVEHAKRHHGRRANASLDFLLTERC